MAKRKPAFWIVRRESDNRLLCRDGLFRDCVADPADIKRYKTDWRAIHFGLNYAPGTAFAVYEGDTIDRDGKITRNADHFSNVSSVVQNRGDK